MADGFSVGERARAGVARALRISADGAHLVPLPPFTPVSARSSSAPRSLSRATSTRNVAPPQISSPSQFAVPLPLPPRRPHQFLNAQSACTAETDRASAASSRSCGCSGPPCGCYEANRLRSHSGPAEVGPPNASRSDPLCTSREGADPSKKKPKASHNTQSTAMDQDESENQGPPPEHRSELCAASSPAPDPMQCPRFKCPFAQCEARSWSSKTQLITHVDNVHLASGSEIPESWLTSFGKVICPSCHVLVTTGGKCR